MSARRRRKLIANIVFTLMCVMAVCIIAFLLWAMMNGE